MIALMLTIELLSFSPTSQRSVGILGALQRAVPTSMRAKATTVYEGKSDLLVLWGPGAPDRFAPMAAQVAKGGHVLALDLAYWHRDRKFRVSIDAAHPQAWVMRKDWPGARFEADRVATGDRWKPAGPVIVAGIGRKARAQYGDAVSTWERDMLAAASSRWPDRRLLYRRKQQDSPTPGGVDVAPHGPIESLLTGSSLVITWHSNVAVDAIRMGIPVICRDGAAAAVCPSAFGPEDPQPLAPEVRDRFMRNLAWYQWAPQEAAALWAWVPAVLT